MERVVRDKVQCKIWSTRELKDGGSFLVRMVEVRRGIVVGALVRICVFYKCRNGVFSASSWNTYLNVLC